MSTLLGICKDVRHVVHEVDHVVFIATGHWNQRTGLHGTRHVEMQEKLMKVKVGMEDPIQPCPEFPGSSGTPPGTPRRTAAGLTSWSLPKARGTIRLAPLSSPPSTARKGSPRKRNSAEDRTNIEEFTIPDYIVAESETLLQIYQTSHQASPDCQEIGPIKRSAKLFEIVVVLCKLRWLVRLHAALMTFGESQCSLQRMLLGMLADACNPENQHLAAPVQVFELVVQTFEHRLQESWPLFIRYVSGIDAETYSKPADVLRRARGGRLCNTSGHRPMSVPQKTGNEARNPYSRNDVVQTNRDDAASLWQIVDDIFIAWMIQADPQEVGGEAVMQELDYFGLPRPIVRKNLDYLRKWYKSVVANPSAVMPRKQSTLLAVQEQGHHLAAFLELPSMRSEALYTKDDLMGMARAIVSHPLTFNVGVRKRLISILMGESRWVGFEKISLTWEADEKEPVSHLIAFATNRLDAGNIAPKLQALQLNTPRAATAWVDKREMLQPTWHHTPRSLPFHLQPISDKSQFKGLGHKIL